MKWYRFDVSEYRKKTEGLADAEDLAYRRLIDIYYLQGRLVNDPALLVELVGLDWDCIEPVLTRYFIATPEGYQDEHIEFDLDKRRRRAKLNSKAGKIGGRGRKKVVDND